MDPGLLFFSTAAFCSRDLPAGCRRCKTLPDQNTIDWDAPEIGVLIRAAFDEDLGTGFPDHRRGAGDATAVSIVPALAGARARIVARQGLVVAGLPLAERVFRLLDAAIRFDSKFEDGAAVPGGADVATVRGRARALVSGERTALNLLTHLSGIATHTRRFVDAIAGPTAHIRHTRKTTPLLRALEKYAVRCGGGTNHRFGLFDAILIKENHIAMAGGVAEAMRRARAGAAPSPIGRETPELTAYEAYQPPANGEPLPIQIEVRDEAELRAAIAAGADSLLLDNTSPEEAGALVRIVRSLRADCAVEVSGGVTLANVRAYAESGANFIAVGAITHSAPAADLSLLIDSRL